MRFDFEETFGEDYLHFYDSHLTDERNRADANDIATFVDLRPGEAVLDAPCGHGRISKLLAEAGFEVVGVDASAFFLEIARGQCPLVDYVRGDLRALPVAGPFDAVAAP